MMLLSLLFCFVLFAHFLELILKLIADRTSFYHCWVLKKISNTSQFLICEKGTYHRSSPPGFSAKQAWKETKRPSRAARSDERRLYLQACILSNKGKNPLYLNPKYWNVKWAFNSSIFYISPRPGVIIATWNDRPTNVTSTIRFPTFFETSSLFVFKESRCYHWKTGSSHLN